MDGRLKNGLEELKVDDNALESVSGGTHGEYYVKVRKNIPAFKIPPTGTGQNQPIAVIAPGSELIGLTPSRQYGGYMEVPVCLNFHIFSAVKTEWFKNIDNVYVDAFFLAEK